jgi:ABC-type nitrate/sulfonate/bicarbonate transport system permease component
MLVVSQTVPIMVIAPLMVIWFGFGLFSKIVVIVVVTFFAITVALSDGLDATEPEATSLLRSMGASRWQQFAMVRLPGALPSFFTGLRISVTWSVTAAIFGEYVGAEKGLGIFMQISKNDFRTDLVLAAVVVSSLVSLLLFAACHVLQRVSIPWYMLMQRQGRQT